MGVEKIQTEKHRQLLLSKTRFEMPPRKPLKSVENFHKRNELLMAALTPNQRAIMDRVVSGMMTAR